MKIAYLEKNFRVSSRSTLELADKVMHEYAADGYDLTLRQLYYQFVARGWIPNTEKSYKSLGKLVSDGRLAGALDWDIMVDRTRELRSISHWTSPGDIVRACAQQYREDTRADQPNYIEVWVEKEALAGIVLQACRDLDVHALICRGYVSQSAMWQAARRLGYHKHRERRIIIYLGDHDPSGLDMARDIHERIENTFRTAVQVDRIALTMEQVAEYDCPPNPAKITDSRFEAYCAEYGDESWELDALEPRVLTQLIKNAVAGYTDDRLRGKALYEQEAGRNRLAEIADTI